MGPGCIALSSLTLDEHHYLQEIVIAAPAFLVAKGKVARDAQGAHAPSRATTVTRGYYPPVPPPASPLPLQKFRQKPPLPLTLQSASEGLRAACLDSIRMSASSSSPHFQYTSLVRFPSYKKKTPRQTIAVGSKLTSIDRRVLVRPLARFPETRQAARIDTERACVDACGPCRRAP